jgi:hypothetical protein
MYKMLYKFDIHDSIIVLVLIIKIVKLLISQTVPPHFQFQNFHHLT